jgi:Competence protein CoiA-like family
MAKEILYTTALDENHKLIHIDGAEKGRSYYCPECKNEFILRKSGKTGRGSKRPHFAHNQLTPNCTPEGVLHYSFKKLTIDLLERYKAENKKLEVNWNCPTCSEYNKGNLLAKTTSTREEYNLKVCQPDIALLDTEGNVIAVIEIVVTHKPEEKVLQYYIDNKIILVQIDLYSDEDLKIVKRKITTPNIVDYCLNPKCSDNGRHSISRKILSYHDNCGGCLQPIDKYKIEVNSAFGRHQTLNFTDSEISFVKSKRNNIQVNTNRTTNKKYPTSICNNCRRMCSRGRSSRRF